MNPTKIPTQSERVPLYAGTSKISSGTLDESYERFKYLLVTFKTNSDYTTLTIPTEEITSSINFIANMVSSSASSETVTDFNLMCLCGICFTSETTFSVIYRYTNSNWVLKPYKIIGIL